MASGQNVPMRAKSRAIAPSRPSRTLVTAVPFALAAGAGAAVYAMVCAIAYEKVGLLGLVVVALPLALLVILGRRYVERARGSVAEIERANEELRRSNTDLCDLLDFTSGLMARVHDTSQLAAYARGALRRLTGAQVEVTVGGEPPGGAMPLRSSHRVVGGLRIDGGDTERWAGLRKAIVPQLAAALGSTMLAEEAHRTHVETIAALSRSMEAKDTCAGPHTGRVSGVAVRLAKRLGYSGADLEAIEIGALMHDIGKIGIPESILHKPGPLDNDEWVVMKRHPVISDLILNEIGLSPIVSQIARSSHERMDGQGYPDGLKGDEIPLPARIVLVADAFDALTTDRPYRRARRPKAALEEIRANAGPQFCPRVVAALERMYQEEPAILGEVPLTVVATA